jgi:hypothetical protein
MSVRIAYLILAHKCPSHLVRLVRRLQGPERAFVIHLDLKSTDPAWDAVVEELNQPNIFWAERLDCQWGGFGLVQAILNSVETLFKTSFPFDFGVLLSGQDYPIKPNGYIDSYLAARSSKCLMYLVRFPNPEWTWDGYYRLPTWRLSLWGKKRRVIPSRFSKQFHRRVPLGYHPYGGSTWWALPKPAMEHIWYFVRNHPEFVRYFREVIYPDEMMLHTILGNSPFQPETGNNYLHFMKWIAGPHPAVLTEEDLPLLQSTDKCFARKFDESVDPRVLDAIDRHILGWND